MKTIFIVWISKIQNIVNRASKKTLYLRIAATKIFTGGANIKRELRILLHLEHFNFEKA